MTVDELFSAIQGEPFCQPSPLAKLGKLVKGLDKTFMTYTGYTLEQLQAMDDPAVADLLAVTDILVDARYEESLWVSENQRVIDVTRTREQDKVVLMGLDYL